MKAACECLLEDEKVADFELMKAKLSADPDLAVKLEGLHQRYQEYLNMEKLRDGFEYFHAVSEVCKLHKLEVPTAKEDVEPAESSTNLVSLFY